MNVARRGGPNPLPLAVEAFTRAGEAYQAVGGRQSSSHCVYQDVELRPDSMFDKNHVLPRFGKFD